MRTPNVHRVRWNRQRELVEDGCPLLDSVQLITYFLDQYAFYKVIWVAN